MKNVVIEVSVIKQPGAATVSTRTVTNTLATTAARLLRLLLQPAPAILSAPIEVFVIQVQNDAFAKTDIPAEIVLKEAARRVCLGLATLAPTMLHMM